MAGQTVGETDREFPEELQHLLFRIHSLLGEWRATGEKAGSFDGIRECFSALRAGAQTADYQDVSRLSRAVEKLMDQYGGNGRISDYDSEQALINLLEEMHDGLTMAASMTPASARDHMRSLTGIVESLLTDREPGTPDSAGRQEENGLCMTRSADGSAMNENRKFSYLLDFSGELGLTRSRLGNTVEQMRRDLNALKYHINQIRSDLQAMDTERGEGFAARVRKVNLQLDTLIRVERKLRGQVSDFSATLNRQSHYGERLQAGLIRAGMVRGNMTLCRVLLVRVGDWHFAIRTAAIERALQTTDEKFSVVDDHRYVQTDDQRIPVFDLVGRTGQSGPGIKPRRRSVLLIRSADQISAFGVDQFEGTAEAAIHTPGTQLASVRGITGITVLADGRIVPVLDPVEFLRRPTVPEPAPNIPT